MRHIYDRDSVFTRQHMKTMFQMYVDTYLSAKQELWFKTPRDMFAYPCSVIVATEQDSIIAFLMFQKRKDANKISLGVHNGTETGKNEAIKLRIDTLQTPGWILEASGASSWLMRKNNVPIITSKKMIEDLLQIDQHNERIVMNIEFDIKCKLSYQYTHQFMKEGIVQFENKETMFGFGGCIFDNDTCQRIFQTT
jgi:hypothetical protein